MLTTDQVRNRTKTVTRRFGWWDVECGQLLRAVEKAQGLKKGEKQVELAVIRIVDHRVEPVSRMLDDPVYGAAEVIREGFPYMTPAEFVAMLLKANKVAPGGNVNRIQFEYVDRC